MTIIWILTTLAIAVLLWLLFWRVVSYIVRRSGRQNEFVKGTVPAEPPNGFYTGSAYLLGNRRVPWLGKSFVAENRLGFNIFTPRGASILKLVTPFYDGFRVNVEGNTEAYNFKTSAGPGFKDKDIETFKLDYDSPVNPFLIRIILDEIIEVAPEQFLGKVHLKVFPGYFATIGFFGLNR